MNRTKMKLARYNVSLETISQLIGYNASDGTFYRKSNNKPAGITRKDNGYVDIGLTICCTRIVYRAHMLVWLFETGIWPALHLDHINGIKHDNRFSNLREVTYSQNGQNVSNKSTGKTGFRGVTFNDKRKYRKFIAQIQVNGKKKSLGAYLTAEDAHTAYLYAKSKYHEYNDRIVGIENVIEVERAIPRFKFGSKLEALCRWCNETDVTKFRMNNNRSRCIPCNRKIVNEREREQRRQKRM